MHSFDAHEYLGTFTNFESRLSSIHSNLLNLERVRRLFGVLGNPQENLKFIHVAGTKGKGSTCAFAAYILRAAGYRVGLYTSPHLYYVNERIRILEPKASSSSLKEDFYGVIGDQEFSRLVKEFSKSIDKIRHDAKLGDLTYFEVLTGLAIVYFSRRKVDAVILETGLGGRLDATNAVDASVSGITPISLDHTAQLGKTLGKIAGEKAAIIKNPQSKVIVGQQPAPAMAVIMKRCRALKIKPFVIGKDIRVKISGKTFSVMTPAATYKSLQTSLAGEHQCHNAAMAIAMVESSGFKVKGQSMARGLRETRWPGRFEIVAKNPTVVVDCAHNVASAQVLVEALQKNFSAKRRIIILGLSNDKDISGVCKILAKGARLVVTTQSKHPRAYRFSDEEMKVLFRNQPVFSVSNIKDALTLARREAAKNDIILVAGSVFVAAEARVHLKGLK